MWALLLLLLALLSALVELGGAAATGAPPKISLGLAAWWLAWATVRAVPAAPERGDASGDEVSRAGTGGHETEKTSHEALAFEPWRAAGDIAGSCSDRFRTPGGPPEHATDLNGLILPDVCFPGPGPHHVFVIGDWGGVYRDAETPVRPADRRTKHLPGQHRPFVLGADDQAQQNVAKQMKARSLKHSPDFVVNVGDNFYWGGVLEECGKPPQEVGDASGQWLHVFENIYDGPGLEGKQWLGVLGNHDFGGFTFTSGWDQAIGYTWSRVASNSGRWMTPALYYSSTVRYSDFSIDFFFIDSNYFDAYHPNMNENHNLCSEQHNRRHATCGVQGPESVNECPRWFERLWKAQIAWLEKGLERSMADWQIVVTHFPPEHGIHAWKRLTRDYGIDLIITGHRHQQEVHYLEDSNFLRPTAYIVSGGGGGITSEGEPVANGTDDQYGFMDLTLSRGEIMIEAVSHGGQIRSTTCVLQRIKGGSAQRPLSGVSTKSLCEGRPSRAQGVESAASAAVGQEKGGGANPRLSQATSVSRPIASTTTSVWAPWPTSQEPTSTTTRTTSVTQTSTRTTTRDPDIPLKCDVALLLTVNNVVYDLLLASTEQLNDFKAAVATAIAPFAGNGVQPKDVLVELSVGSVLVRATVRVSSCVAARLARYRLISSPALGNTVAWLVANIRGIEEVTVGTISVTDLRVSAVEEKSVPYEASSFSDDELGAAATSGRSPTSGLDAAPLPTLRPSRTTTSSTLSSTTTTTTSTATTSSSSTSSSSSTTARSGLSKHSGNKSLAKETSTQASAKSQNTSNASSNATNCSNSSNTSMDSRSSNTSAKASANVSESDANSSRSANDTMRDRNSSGRHGGHEHGQGHSRGGSRNNKSAEVKQKRSRGHGGRRRRGSHNDRGAEAKRRRRRRRDCHVIALMKVNHVNFHALSKRSGLLKNFKVSIASALAVVAGNWIDPEHVELALKSGSAKGHLHDSVAVRAQIGRPSFVSASWVQSTLSESASLDQTVADMVSSIEGIQEVSSATITVSGVRIYHGDGSADAPCHGPSAASNSSSSPVVSKVALPPQSVAAERLPRRGRLGTSAGGSSDTDGREDLVILLAASGVLVVCIPYCLWRSRQGQVSYSELVLVTTDEGKPMKAVHSSLGPWGCAGSEDADREALLGSDEPLLSGL